VRVAPQSYALDATYSVGNNLSGVGVYSREILLGLSRAHPEARFLYYYRSHRLLTSLRESIPSNASRRILHGAPRVGVYHALNQRVDFDRAAFKGQIVVATFHDLFVMTADYSSPEFRARFTAQARRAAERSDRIIAVSAFTAAQVEGLLKVERSRIRVIPHGVRLPERPNTPLENPQCENPPGESTTRQNLVLFVGAIQKRKNVARLVKAFERLPDSWKLVLAGSSEGYGAAEELRAVEQSPRRAAIEVRGYVSAAELDALYWRARIFAFPSLDEGFGMPVLDAMAHQIPVITSSMRSALPEVAGGAALLVDPEDVEALGDALVRLASDEALAHELVRRGYERARSFTWESAVEKTWAVYQERP
jgi:glycosyltransferase involved in cell wall biosynthesis